MLTNKRIYYINSHNRINGTHSDFLHKVDIPPGESYDRVCVLSAIIPKSYYLIQQNFNTFTLRENGVNATVTIPVGNYTAITFKTTLQTALNTATMNGWVYTVTFNQQNGKYTYTVAGNGGNQPTFITTTNVYEQLGFDSNSVVNFVGNTVTSTNVIKMQVEDAIFIHSDMSCSEESSVLQEIFTAGSADFSSIKYECLDFIGYSKVLSSDKNNVYRFTITNEDGRILDLNGLNVNITLCVYKKDDINQQIRNYLKFKLLMSETKENNL